MARMPIEQSPLFTGRPSLNDRSSSVKHDSKRIAAFLEATGAEAAPGADSTGTEEVNREISDDG